jgi:hypothetical protein
MRSRQGRRVFSAECDYGPHIPVGRGQPAATARVISILEAATRPLKSLRGTGLLEFGDGLALKPGEEK